MRIALVVDTLAVAVATVDGADKDSEEARMLPFSSIFDRLGEMPKADPLLTESLVKNAVSTDAYSGPLSSDTRGIIKRLVSKEENVLYWQKNARELHGLSISPKRFEILKVLVAHREQNYRLKVELHAQIKAAVATDQFKNWFHLVTLNPAGNSPPGKYKAISGKLGVPEAAAVIMMALFDESIVKLEGKVVQDAEFDHWFDLDIKSKEDVLQHLSPSAVLDFKMPLSWSEYIAAQYMVHYKKKLAKLSSLAVVVP
uniref:RxLR effector candidate protein n=1 Tax=Peronospora matthiolae TaxID=2874970 RepID=A0AAV1UUN8_9STRA